VIVGSGPNGLGAAVTLARAGYSTLVLEATSQPGGGCRSAELTRPGFVHDVCSAIHPLAAASPLFRELPLTDLGVEMIQPEVAAAHPLDGGRAAFLERDVKTTAAGLGADGKRYEALMTRWVRREPALLPDFLRPIRVPKHPFTTASFGLRYGFRSVTALARSFETEEAGGLLAGMAAHSMLALNEASTAAMAVMFMTIGHAYGWPLVKGGSQKLADGLVAQVRRLGGEIETDRRIGNMADIPPSRVVLFDLTPRQVVAIAKEELPSRYARSMSRFRYGPGVFKVDWALSGPVPWRSDACRRAGTVHVGGTLAEVATAEADVVAGRVPERPFVLVAQQSLFDRRAPDGNHTLWGYCHVPNGSDVDMTERIEAQIERFAPGFRDLVVERHVMDAPAMQRYNENYVGGDINGGMQNLRQLFARPVLRWDPYSTPNERLFICSSSTPPGGGVHGMCGYNAALVAMKRLGKGT